MKIKKNVIVGNLDKESREVLNEMGFEDNVNLSDSFQEYLKKNLKHQKKRRNDRTKESG